MIILVVGKKFNIKEFRRRRWSSPSGFWRDFLFVATASLLLHALVLLIVSLLPAEEPPWKKREMNIVTDFEDKEALVELPPLEADIPELDLLSEIKIDEVLPAEAPKAEEPLIVIEDTTEDDVAGEEDLLSLADLLDSSLGKEGTGLDALAVMGMEMKASGDGLPSAYKGRSSTSEKKKRAQSYGADPKVLASVESALMWLAAHQNSDGSWPIMLNPKAVADPNKPEAKKAKVAPVENAPPAPEDKEPKKDKVERNDAIEAVTASALLAFLGAGHTELSGPYKNTVRRGIRYLNERVLAKAKRPLFGRNYGSALILMALSESSLFGSSPLSKQNANAIAEMFIKEYKGEGWSYSGAGDDFSVSGWVALGLKSARYADLPSVSDEVIEKLFGQYGKWVNKMTHADTGKGNYRNNKEGSLAMSYVGMFQKQFLGFPKNDPFLLAASELGVKELKKQFDSEKKTWKDEYSIYYGTLAAFQQQGAFWKVWNPVMQSTLLATQREGAPQDMGGSWDPSDRQIGSHGGRVMTTALMSLCLEVYYRYEMMH
jgi:hypothetical protein